MDIRFLAHNSHREAPPGWSLGALAGLIRDAPLDLSERHDDYLASDLDGKKGARPRAR